MNTLEQAKQLIVNTCEHYKIKHEQLTAMSKTNHYKICTNEDGELVRLAEIRMALSYFIYKYCPMTLTRIGPLVGYVDHSTMSTYRNRIEHYIKTEDPKFFPYYLTIIDLASDLGIKMDLERVKSNSFIKFKDYKGQIYLVDSI